MILTLLLLLLSQSATPTRTPLQDAAVKARLAGRLDEATAKYRQALEATPGWAEGWYSLGTIHYEQDRPRECADAFTRFLKMQPNVASGSAFLGLCLFQLRDYANSLKALNRAERIGMPQGDQLTDVASYHAAMLYTRDGNFEKALQILSPFSRRETIEPKLIELSGIAALRRAVLPTDLPAKDRELMSEVGRAVMTAAARRPNEAVRMFDDLIADFPLLENLHFAYGSMLLGSDPAAALRQFEKELQLQPNHVPTLVIMGLENLRYNKFAEARTLGERVVHAAPGNFAGYTVLGRALAEGDIDIPGGVAALEKAVALESGSPQVRLALASAYAKAGRKEDAAKQRAEFQRIKKSLDGGEK